MNEHFVIPMGSAWPELMWTRRHGKVVTQTNLHLSVLSIVLHGGVALISMDVCYTEYHTWTLLAESKIVDNLIESISSPAWLIVYIFQCELIISSAYNSHPTGDKFICPFDIYLVLSMGNDLAWNMCTLCKGGQCENHQGHSVLTVRLCMLWIYGKGKSRLTKMQFLQQC